MRRFIQIIAGLICCCLFSNLRAQVCNGSLGDPVVNIDFGSGTNPGNALQSAVTTYSFTSSSCPDDGSYTVVNSSYNCFGSTWHSVPEDHTPGDAQGYMMLVNASFTPGDFFVDTVKNLCASTTYEFAAWIANVLLPTACSPNPIRPKLVFNIETTGGTVLGTYSTGDIASTGSPSWKQYGLFFTTPANTSNIVIRITNTAPGGCGNDLALDDITFRPCGPTAKSYGDNNETTFDRCTGNPTSINIASTVGAGYNDVSRQWQESLDHETTWTDIAGMTSPTYLFNKVSAGTYKYRIAVADGANILLSNCRIASNIVSITIHENPIASASGNSPVCENNMIKLAGMGGSIFSWTGPAGFTDSSSTPTFPAVTTSTGLYNLITSDQFGCSDTASTMVTVKPKPATTISNDQSLCEGESVIISAGGGISYEWSPVDGLSAVSSPGVTASPADTTKYNVVVTGANGCTDTASVNVNIWKKPVANAGADKAVLKGESVVINGEGAGTSVTYHWTPERFLVNSTTLTPTAMPTEEMVYTLHAVSGMGCGIATDDVLVKVYNDLYIPSAFSPNNDGLNDTWRIEALVAFPDALVRVFNRFGQLIFEADANGKGWDGSFKNIPLPVGAYPYIVDLKNNRPVRKGMVMIVR